MIVQVHHKRVDGYIRGNVRWPRGTNYFAADAFNVLSEAELSAIDADPAIQLVTAKKAPEGATVHEALDLVVKTEEASEPREPELTLDQFIKQMLEQDPEKKNEAWWTQAGKPEVAHLVDSGYDVGGKERDEAYDSVIAAK